MAGETAFVAARTIAQEQSSTRYAEYTAIAQRVAEKAKEVHRRTALLQAERTSLVEKLHQARKYVDAFEEGRRRPTQPAVVADLAGRISKGLFPLPGWKPGMPLDSTMEDIQAILEKEKQQILSPAAAAAPAPLVPPSISSSSSAAATTTRGGGMEVDLATGAPQAPPPPPPPPSTSSAVSASVQPLPRPSTPSSGPPPPATSRAAAASSSSSSSSSTADFLAAMQQLPPAARMEILGLFPRGWKPGDPLPAQLPDPRTLLAKYGILPAKAAGGPAAAGAGK
jgi:hypothetical protein